MFGWSEWPMESLATARRLAKDAIAVDGQNGDAHTLLANILRFTREFDAAHRHIAIALEINPNDPQTLAVQSQLLLLAGEIERSIPPLELAIRLDPVPRPFWLFTLSEAYYLLGRYSDAVALLQRHRERIQEDPAPLAVLAASLAQLDQAEDAARTAEALKRSSPFFDADGFVAYFAPPEQRGHLLEGLRKAGL